MADGKDVDEAIANLQKDALELLTEGEQPHHTLPHIVPFEASVRKDGKISSYTFDAVIFESEPGAIKYCSFCPEVGTASCGHTFDHALAMIKEATELYLDEVPLPDYSKPELVSFTLNYHAE